MCGTAWVAQLVEHFPEEEGVGGSSPPPSTVNRKSPFGGFFYDFKSYAKSSFTFSSSKPTITSSPMRMTGTPI